jgi:hypothetical protein
MNPGRADLLGYTSEELTAADFTTISHPDQIAQDREAKTQLISGSGRLRSITTRRAGGCWSVTPDLTPQVHFGRRDLSLNSLDLNDLVANRITDQIADRPEAKLSHDIGAMGLNGLHADAQR